MNQVGILDGQSWAIVGRLVEMGFGDANMENLGIEAVLGDSSQRSQLYLGT